MIKLDWFNTHMKHLICLNSRNTQMHPHIRLLLLHACLVCFFGMRRKHFINAEQSKRQTEIAIYNSSQQAAYAFQLYLHLFIFTCLELNYRWTNWSVNKKDHTCRNMQQASNFNIYLYVLLQARTLRLEFYRVLSRLKDKLRYTPLNVLPVQVTIILMRGKLHCPFICS